MSQNKLHTEGQFRLIPWWAYAVATLLVVGLNVGLGLLYSHDKTPPPFPVLLFICVFSSAFLACFILLVGYVNADAKRRNMNSALWTAVVILLPSAIGFILYFLVRKPVLVECPQCHAMVHPGSNFCPKCKYELRPTCPACQSAVRAGDTFCSHCAHELKPPSV